MWRSYGVTIIGEKLTIVDNRYKGTNTKEWTVAVEWRMGIGEKPGSYHIIDLPIGNIKVKVDDDFKGTLIYQTETD